ncbi:class F sortase [Streptomyces bambusae]|uniref:class F sortase n=1 Tax=Streptomyces bambusae TaxID=1550616 RepID=UPI001CFD24E5|nr:class F sortase [Streptomyces bambusae]MCB5164832.1 class F sortase [Streptomyces bambusae]
MTGVHRNVRLGGLVLVAAWAGVWLIGAGIGGGREEPPQPAAEESAAARTGGRELAPLAPSAPLRIRIPAIRVDAPLTGLGLRPDGRLEVPPPEHGDLAGWYRDGTAPGAAGTAVVTGHVDDARGRAVFYELGALRRGAAVEVARRDGRTAVFTVYAVEVYDAKAFPDHTVYGRSPRAELRVITCGGGFSARTGYRGNVVVFAHLTGTR